VNIKEYIESGILEAYVLGTLSPDESREVAQTVAQYPELVKELEAIETAIQQFSANTAPALPGDMEDKIWKSIQTASNNNSQNTPPTDAPKVLPFQPAHNKPVQWKLAASVIGLAGSLALNAFLWNNNNKNSEATKQIASRMDSMNTQQKQLAALLDNYQKAKDMMSDTAMQTIVMHTMQKGHPMAATLYWSKENGVAYVSVDGLPAPPPGMQYQLWAIQGGKPVDMGILPNEMANTPSIQRVGKSVMGGEAFAISLEKEGGSPVPTMENIYVLGKA
jgi:anti-sigma-K factor RskA